MGNSLRCCLACVLPCGALDVIRIVHLNGHVEEFSRPVPAGEVLKSHPGHILSRPCSQGVARKILILSPDSELRRGQIYFLIPSTSLPEKKKQKKILMKKQNRNNDAKHHHHHSRKSSSDDDVMVEEAEDKHKKRRCWTGRVGVWRPHLESISEDIRDLPSSESGASSRR
ncbi:hypothetical protein QJS10_CPB21g01465 [Acorus calamus]|uniref:6,7-dimethyl-8-ribityllumazine synthase n=1 Tax=Acorus calamus TaxID=4465 RepID=A0AAV9C6R2_ACOCL|nr:hypothetical protein QJS10_CPB21g01465 [Acorus calamus]